MESQMLYHATAKDVFTFATIFTGFYRANCKYDSSLLKNNVLELEQENELLQKVVYKIRKREYTSNLKQADERVNQGIIALKMFVKANMHFPNKEDSRKAAIVWRLIEKHGSDLNRKGYLTKNVVVNSLLMNLEEEKFKTIIEPLLGVRKCMSELRAACNELKEIQVKSIYERVKRKQDVEATSHAKTMMKTINSMIIPMLNILHQMEPDKYRSLFKFTQKELLLVNASVRRRRGKWGQKGKDESGDTV
ncbi:DUF6261 family protein [Labilibaculum antarcticum]|uniref:Uncharacterized protein n=1 Tax=Labilibaculum antarcticum TaxID=1717717 RepID=A0A1Y1CK01_9BACT|nr:DUF6261 family protein [Labilibaculum antarcticum]BAX80738.1 hypothetical protein ALGA_2411 [Labilibaculum antarcticum]